MTDKHVTHLLPELMVESIKLLPLHLPLVLSRVSRELFERIRMSSLRRGRSGIIVNDGTQMGDRIRRTDQVLAGYRCMKWSDVGMSESGSGRSREPEHGVPWETREVWKGYMCRALS